MPSPTPYPYTIHFDSASEPERRALQEAAAEMGLIVSTEPTLAVTVPSLDVAMALGERVQQKRLAAVLRPAPDRRRNRDGSISIRLPASWVEPFVVVLVAVASMACGNTVQPTPLQEVTKAALTIQVMGMTTEKPMKFVPVQLMGGTTLLTDWDGQAWWTVDARHDYTVTVCGRMTRTQSVITDTHVWIWLPEEWCR